MPGTMTQTADDRLLREERFLHRIGPEIQLLVIQWLQTTSGERHTRISIKPWEGL